MINGSKFFGWVWIYFLDIVFFFVYPWKKYTGGSTQKKRPGNVPMIDKQRENSHVGGMYYMVSL